MGLTRSTRAVLKLPAQDQLSPCTNYCQCVHNLRPDATTHKSVPALVICFTAISKKRCYLLGSKLILLLSQCTIRLWWESILHNKMNAFILLLSILFRGNLIILYWDNNRDSWPRSRRHHFLLIAVKDMLVNISKQFKLQTPAW